MNTRILIATVLALATLAPPALHAAGDLTIGKFRQATDGFQIGFVDGWVTFAKSLGMRCKNGLTVGEMRAALRFRRTLAEAYPVHKALTALAVEHACRVYDEPTPAPPVFKEKPLPSAPARPDWETAA